MNRELLGQLRQRVEEDGEDRVGDIFLKICFALKIYSRYIGDYDAARQTVAEVEGLPRFAQFAEGVDAKVAERAGRRPGTKDGSAPTRAEAAPPERKTSLGTRGNKMGSLMMMPVQRVPRYELLLRELLKTKRKLGDAQFIDELEQCAGRRGPFLDAMSRSLARAMSRGDAQAWTPSRRSRSRTTRGFG